MTLLWPEKVLRPRSINASLAAVTLTGGRSIGGTETVVTTDAGYWKVTLQGVKPSTLSEQKCWDAVAALIDGRANAIAVPLGKHFTAPWPLDASGRRLPRGVISFSDGSFFSDGSGWSQDLIVATIRAASLRAPTIIVDMISGQAIEPGHFIGIGTDRAYRIKSAVADGNAYTCQISPTLRAAVTAGTPANFDMPRVKCRMTSDEGMSGAFDLGRFGEFDISFVEDY